jgi:hypothetical protein
MADHIAEFCRNCGTPNIGKKKFCRECGTSLIKNTGTEPLPPAAQSPVSPAPQKMDAVSKGLQIAEFRDKIVRKQKEIDKLNNFKGTVILAVIGILSMIWFPHNIIAYALIGSAISYFVWRHFELPRLSTEISTLEAQIRELERN